MLDLLKIWGKDSSDIEPSKSTRNQIIKDITNEHLKKIYTHKDKRKELGLFCDRLFKSSAVSISVNGHLPQQGTRAIFITNHVTVVPWNMFLFNNTYSLPYHAIFSDYIVSRLCCCEVFHIHKKPAVSAISLEQIAAEVGYILIKDGENDIADINEQVVERIAKGENLVVAPEGRFHQWNHVGIFKPGFIHWAQMTGTPIIPVKISGFQTFGPSFEFLFHPPIPVDGSKKPKEWAEWFRSEIFCNTFGLVKI